MTLTLEEFDYEKARNVMNRINEGENAEETTDEYLAFSGLDCKYNGDNNGGSFVMSTDVTGGKINFEAGLRIFCDEYLKFFKKDEEPEPVDPVEPTEP